MGLKEERFWYVKSASEAEVCDPHGLSASRTGAWTFVLPIGLTKKQRKKKIAAMRSIGWKCVRVSVREIVQTSAPKP